jgi:dipeptidyl aminopeptidase/acylaminoacyl peptidase
MRVAASGGKPELIAKARDGEIADGPQMLPNGRSVLFTVTTAVGPERWNKAQIVVQPVGSTERTTLIDGGSDGRYLSTGHLLYAESGTLFAVPFDVSRLKLTGGPVPVIEGIRRAGTPDVNTGIAHFSVSHTGSMAYVPGPSVASAALRELVRVDAKGQFEPLAVPRGSFDYPRVSPNGKRLAVGNDDGKEENVWIYDLTRSAAPRRLTFGGRNRAPIWSADGTYVTFQSDREGDSAIFWQRADGSGTAERLTRPESGTAHFPDSWAPDGGTLLFTVTNAGQGTALWALSLREKKAAPFGGIKYPPSIGVLVRAAFSPDGRWVAYGDAGGVYVQPFPATGAKYQIAGGNSPAWSRDGKQLFYVLGAQLAVVHITTTPDFSFGVPTTVIPAGRLQLLSGLNAARKYDVAPDGSIVGVVNANDASQATGAAAPINVVLNWTEELKQRAPVSAR